MLNTAVPETADGEERMPEIRCFSHVGMTVADLDFSVAFYTGVLGFQVLFEVRGKAWGRVGIGIDAMMLELFSPHPTGGPNPTGQALEPADMLYPAPYGRPKIALTVADIDAAYDELVKLSVPVIGPVTDTGKSRLFFVLDPDGTLIQLHQFDGGQERVAELFGR
ncbi:VOC family protein [Parafrankia sp. FMc6]|uniref:VOC family protein n=1 Tax=Parafrankia soli TaxID=2599596 RepID=UPI0034D71776